MFREHRRITDARLKIIQKNRSKIRDARDKLAEITRNNGDVRKKLMQKQELTTYKYNKMSSGSSGGGSGSGGRRTVSKIIPAGGLKTKSSNYKTSSLPVTRRRENNFDIPRGYVDYDNMEKMEEGEYFGKQKYGSRPKIGNSKFNWFDQRNKLNLKFINFS